MNKIVFTICSTNYIAQAIALGHSMAKYNPDYDFVIGLVDRKHPDVDYTKIPFTILEVENIPITDFEGMVNRYDIVELNTSVKPCYFNYFLSLNKYNYLIYMDPDTEVFAAFDALESELVENDIVITPHFLSPINDDKWQAEEDFLNAGVYNLGFIAIKDTDNSRKMIDWWEDRLRTKAYINFCKGMFTDQLWISFVPAFYERVKIFKNMGYNVAYWNLHERTLSVVDGKYFINDTTPLVFYHYASFRPLNPTLISSGQRRYTFEDRPDIVSLFQNYCTTVFGIGYKEFNKTPCYFVAKKEDEKRIALETYQNNIPTYKKTLVKIVKFIRRIYRYIIRKMGVDMHS